jgi:16S rRNA (uracil1498-N3)-methyltransferase
VKQRDDRQRQRLFYAPPAGPTAPRAGEVVHLDAEQSHHLLHVLRTPHGSDLRLTDGRGVVMTGRLVGRDGDRARIDIEDTAADDIAVAAPRLTLVCALIKGRRFDWVVEKAVELGVHALVPLLTERTVVSPRPGRRRRWQTLGVTALKQSGRSFLPDVAAPTPLADLLAAPADGRRFWGEAPAPGSAGGDEPLPWPRLVERYGPEASDVGDRRVRPTTLTLLIGPEGGWSRAETAALRATGAEPIALGRHVLRSETAAVVGMVALQALRDAWLVG